MQGNKRNITIVRGRRTTDIRKTRCQLDPGGQMDAIKRLEIITIGYYGYNIQGKTKIFEKISNMYIDRKEFMKWIKDRQISI